MLRQALLSRSFSSSAFCVERYLATHGAPAETIEFYKRQCDQSGSILELGCGDGRILQSIAAIAGTREHKRVLMGLDINQDFVDLCSPLKSSGIEVKLGDMANFDLNRRFNRILIPSSALYALSHSEVIECLQSVHLHLNEDGGKLIFDVYNVDDMADEDWGWEEGQQSGQNQFGDLVRALAKEDVYELSKHDCDEQKVQVRYIHVLSNQSCFLNGEGGDEAAMPVSYYQYELQHQYLYSYQLQNLLERTGFEIESICGDFHGTEYHYTSPQVVMTCKAVPSHAPAPAPAIA